VLVKVRKCGTKKEDIKKKRIYRWKYAEIFILTYDG
jgi:hypothetical protein